MKEDKKLDKILELIWELPTEDLESLWEWFYAHTLVGGMIVESK